MLVGREVALRAAGAALDATLSGRGRLLLVGGEAGIGKTTVVREVADRAGAAGALARWGACWEGGSLMPFAPWIDALRRPGGDGCQALSERLAEGVATAAPDAATAARARLRLFADVVDEMGRAAAARPQVVVLEDVHWADTATLELLRAVAPHLPSMATLVVATYRDDELDLSALGGIGGGADWLPLTGLSEEEVSSVLADVMGGAPSPEDVRSVHRRTAGNPLFVTQVGRLLAAGSAGVPAGVREVLARRLARLPEASDRALAAAAVLGTEFDVADVVALTDRPRHDVEAALEAAARARLAHPVEGRPDRWGFVHELVRAVRYEAAGAVERAELHRRAVDILEGQPGVPPGVLAHHAAHARFDADDPRPSSLAVRAAREALARMAWREGAALAERALEAAPSGPDGDPSRAEALLALGDARLRTGEDQAAAGAFEGAAEIGRRHGDADILARSALGFAAGLGGFEVPLLDHRQVSLLEEAAAVLPADATLRPLVLARLSVALSFMGADERRRALADEAVDLARARGDHAALAAAIAARCDAIAGPDHVAERLGAATEIVALAQRAGDVTLELLGRRLRAVALLELRDLDDFDAEVAAYATIADRLGDPLYSWYVPMWRAMRAHADGRLDEAVELAAEALAIGRSGGSLNAGLLHRVFRLCLATDRRDPAALEDTWREMVAGHPDLFSGIYRYVMPPWFEAEAGRADAVRHLLAGATREYIDQVPRDQEWLVSLAQLVIAASTTADRRVLGIVHELLLPYEGLGVFEGLGAVDRGVVDRFLAVAAGHIGDADAVERHVASALAGAEAAGRLVAAHTLADCARAFAAAGDEHRAAELAGEAVARYEALGLDARTAELAAWIDRHPRAAGDVAPEEGSLVREGDSWAFTYGGETVRIRHAKGIADLAVLLDRPGQEVHVRTLEVVPDGPAHSAQPALDDEAVAAYRTRLRDIEEELDEAERHADVARVEKLTVERDALVEELTRSFGLGGRRRAAGSDPDERLRKAVSARVKASIDRLEALHPALGRHLRNSVRTGYTCSYRPERGVVWHVEARGPA